MEERKCKYCGCILNTTNEKAIKCKKKECNAAYNKEYWAKKKNKLKNAAGKLPEIVEESIVVDGKESEKETVSPVPSDDLFSRLSLACTEINNLKSRRVDLEKQIGDVNTKIEERTKEIKEMQSDVILKLSEIGFDFSSVFDDLSKKNPVLKVFSGKIKQKMERKKEPNPVVREDEPEMQLRYKEERLEALRDR